MKKKTKKVVDKNLIEASKMQPGMIIAIKRSEEYTDIVLVIAKTGFTEVDYTYLDYQDGQDAFCGSINGKELVKVMKGKRKKQIFKSIRDDVFKNLHDAENKVNTIRLIEAMDKSLR